MLGGIVNLGHGGYYLHWGVVQISAANAIIIGLMLAVFVAAIVVPFPKGRR